MRFSKGDCVLLDGRVWRVEGWAVGTPGAYRVSRPGAILARGGDVVAYAYDEELSPVSTSAEVTKSDEHNADSADAAEGREAGHQ